MSEELLELTKKITINHGGGKKYAPRVGAGRERGEGGGRMPPLHDLGEGGGGHFGGVHGFDYVGGGLFAGLGGGAVGFLDNPDGE